MRLLLLLGLGLLRFRSLPAQADASDLHAGQFPAVSHRAVITFPAPIFERDDLFVFTLLKDFTRHRRAFDERRAVSDFIAIGVKEHIRENTLFAGFLIEKIDIDDVASRDAMLSTASFDNC